MITLRLLIVSRPFAPSTVTSHSEPRCCRRTACRSVQTFPAPNARARASGHSANPPRKLKVRLRIFGSLRRALSFGFLSMPRTMLPLRCAASHNDGKTAATERCCGLPAYTPATKGSIRWFVASGPMRRAKKAATLSSPLPGLRLTNGSARTRALPCHESNDVPIRPIGEVGISIGRPLIKMKRRLLQRSARVIRSRRGIL